MTTTLSAPPATGTAPAIAPPAFASRYDLGVISIAGVDAEGFLQGQFTADVAALAPGRWTWTGWCTPKGRLLVVFRLARLADGFALELPVFQTESIATRLRRYVMRAKVTISVPTPAPACLWLRGPAVAALVDPTLAEAPADRVLGNLAAPVFVTPEAVVAHLDPVQAAALHPALAAAARELAGSEVSACEIAAGIPWLAPGTEEAFIPQMIGLDVVDGVSFSKGCYPGQEIVARTRYLGTVKRTLHRLRLSTPAVPGDPILADPDQSVGTVLRIAAAPEGGFVALAVLDVEAASGALRTATGTVSDVCAIHPPPAV